VALLRVLPLPGSLRFQTSTVTDNYGLLTIPFGPNKLSKFLQTCLDGLAGRPEKPKGQAELQRPACNDSERPNIFLCACSNELSRESDSKSLLILPAVPSARPSTSQPQAPELPWTSTQSPRILIVDDNAANLHVLRAYLEKLWHHSSAITDADNGETALKAVEKSSDSKQGCGPQVIFKDMPMPIMNGLESTRRIRKLERERLGPEDENGKRSFIVAVTAMASKQEQGETFGAGVNRFVVKAIAISADEDTHGGVGI
jgi:CheY-like chemotaxis protein